MNKLLAFILHSSMKSSRNIAVGIPALHVAGSSLKENREPCRAGPRDRAANAEGLNLWADPNHIIAKAACEQILFTIRTY